METGGKVESCVELWLLWLFLLSVINVQFWYKWSFSSLIWTWQYITQSYPWGFLSFHVINWTLISDNQKVTKVTIQRNCTFQVFVVSSLRCKRLCIIALIRLLLYRLLFVTYLFPCHRKGKNQWKKCQRQKRGDMIVHLSSTIEKFNTSVFFSRPQKSFIQVCFFLDHRKVIYKSVY